MASKIKISLHGMGYVGPPHAVVFAGAGYDVWGLDIKPEIIEQLSRGVATISETGLESGLRQGLEQGNLNFTTNVSEAVLPTNIHMFCVGTPSREDGSADTSALEQAVSDAADVVRTAGDRSCPDLFVIKSTVPIGTNEMIYQLLKQKGVTNFAVVSCPEFMAEATALRDLSNPNKIVVGINPDHPNADVARRTMRAIYDPFMHTDRGKLIECSPVTAELIKYACNGALAVNISYANDIAALSDHVGGDYKYVWDAFSRDPRIGGNFRKPGPGFAGMCFPKDLRGLREVGRRYGVRLYTVEAALDRNREQKLVGGYKVLAHFDQGIEGKTIGLWGLAFKANTDDIRESAAIELSRFFVERGARVLAYCVNERARNHFQDLHLGESVTVVDTAQAAAQGDAVVLLTESKLYQGLDLDTTLAPSVQLFVDMRNHLADTHIEGLKARGVTYRGIGRHNR